MRALWEPSDQWDRWEDGPLPATNDEAAETDAQRGARLEREMAGLHDMVHQLHRDFVQVVERLPVLQDRATNAEEALEQVRKRARVLYEAIYRGKITRAEDILRAMDPIVHS